MQIVLTYTVLEDLMHDRSKMFNSNRLPGAISAIFHIREQKFTKYFLLDGVEKVFNDDKQIIPILKLKQNNDLQIAPDDLDNESKWSLNKTGRIVFFNLDNLESNSAKNKFSHRIYCNPYDDTQVHNYLRCLKDEEHVSNTFNDFLTNLKNVPLTDVIVYADRFVFTDAQKFELPLHLVYAADVLSSYLANKLEMTIKKLMDFTKSRKQTVFIFLKRDSFSNLRIELQPNYLDQFIILIEDRAQKHLAKSGNTICRIRICDIHDRFIFSDYFMIRSTTSIETKWSNVNYQGISQNSGEYFKGVRHVITGKHGTKENDANKIPELFRLINNSPLYENILKKEKQHTNT